MPIQENFEFVNRTEELEVLRNRVYPRVSKGTCTFLRAPSGFGKSRLTDRLIDEIHPDGAVCVVVEPSIRSKSRSERIYAWFFVQRAAEPTARRAVEGRKEFILFSDFVRKRQIGSLNWRQVGYENAKSAASPSGFIKALVEFGENLFKLGRYSPDALLQEDSKYAGEIAQRYVDALAKDRPTLIIVREAQNIDPESLKFFLSLSEAAPCCSLIFEYTSSEYRFSTEHQKIIFETVADKEALVIFDMVRLDLKEFRYLLRKYAPEDKRIEALAEMHWDGNLRIIRELKYRIMVGNSVDRAPSLNLQDEIHKNIAALTQQKRMVLALVVVHVESIDTDTLVSTMRRINPALSTADVTLEVMELEAQEEYIRTMGNMIAVADEDIIEAVKTSPPMLAVLKLAAVSLRDFYLDVIDGKLFAPLRLQAALRQAVALCALTGDIFALRNLIKTLDASARQAHNQGLYIGIVADVALARDGLSDIEKQDLCGWAAAAAYDAGDSVTATKLIEVLPQVGPFEMGLLACCYGSVNRHEEALQLSARLMAVDTERIPDAMLAGKLIECLTLFALRRKSEATAIHSSLRHDPAYADSKLFGYVLRFTEIIEDFPNCTDDVLASVEAFRHVGFLKSAAYSQLAGAMHLAYAGQLDEARQLVIGAEVELKPFLHDQQLVDNDAVVVELLSEDPNVVLCIDRLNSTLLTCTDDFTRLTLQSNLLICFGLIDDRIRAAHAIEVIDQILAAPGFGNRDIFVTVCYNVWRYLTDISDSNGAARHREIALSVNLETSCYSDYWKVRFGFASECGKKFDFLLRSKYHPDYLSHWQIDLDGLGVLKAGPGR